MTSVAKKAKNIAIVSFASYIEYLAGFIASVLIARSLGPSLFGSYAFLIWLVGQLVIFGLHGVNLATIKFVGRSIGSHEEQQLSALLRYLRKISLISGVCVLTVYAGCAHFLPTKELPFSPWVSGGFIVLASMARATYRFNLAIAQAREKYEVGAIAQSVSAITYAAIIASLLFFELNLTYYIAAYLVTSVLQCLLIFVKAPTVQGLKPQSQNLTPELRKEVNNNLLFGAQFVIVSGFSWGAIEFFLLKKYASLEEVAFFSVALTLAKAASELCIGGFSSTLTPMLAKLMGPDSRFELNRILSEFVAIFTILAAIISCLAIVALPGVVTLFYGANYTKAIPFICILMIFTAIPSIYTPISAYQMVNDKPTERMVQSLFSATLNVIFALLIIPQYTLVGAIFCFCINMLIYPAVGWFYVRKAIKISVRGTFFLKILLSSFIAIAAAFPISKLDFKLSFLPATAVCLVVLVASAILLKAFPSHYFTNALLFYHRVFKRTSVLDKLALYLSVNYAKPLNKDP
jgi:O-antigen/teichoic acid export membrane protein